MTRPIRLLIVDDHPIVRDGIRGVFAGDAEFEVVGEAGDGREALARVDAAAAAEAPVDVVLMDLRMPHMGGREAIAALRTAHPDVRVLVLTTYDTDRDALPAIEAGAIGYLLKDSPRDQLVAGVRSAAAGQPVLAPSVATRLMGALGASAAPKPAELTERELEVIRLVAEGATNRQIATQLFISEATVKTHLIHLYDKLDARDRASAVAAAYQRRLLQ
jgi:DNA-binding NarL/FixJ family response regulator